jgi:hypothetical protein
MEDRSRALGSRVQSETHDDLVCMPIGDEVTITLDVQFIKG